jgi:hypothetical protein
MISWTAPHNGGDPIDKYLIEIADSTGSVWNTDLTDCDGSSSTVMSNMYCIISMSTLTSSPFNYVFN